MFYPFVSDRKCSFDLAVPSECGLCPPFTAILLVEDSSTFLLHTWPSSVSPLSCSSHRDLRPQPARSLRPPSPGPSLASLPLQSPFPWLWDSASSVFWPCPDCSPLPLFLKHPYHVLTIVICVLLFAPTLSCTPSTTLLRGRLPTLSYALSLNLVVCWPSLPGSATTTNLGYDGLNQASSCHIFPTTPPLLYF